MSADREGQSRDVSEQAKLQPEDRGDQGEMGICVDGAEG
jgi:hypothetical protein